MRSNSGKGKSNNNLRDPTMKEHEQERRKGRKVPPSDVVPMDETSDA
jgi:hypothetical protein